MDLLAHGETEITPNQDVSVTANAKMLKEVLDALKIDRVDLVGNDSGGGIAQIFAALNPERVRTLTLTNCDAHDNWPPEAFKPFVEMVKAGGLRDTLSAMLAKKAIFRSPGALGPAYERPESVTDEDIETFLRPLVRTEQRTLDLERFVRPSTIDYCATTYRQQPEVTPSHDASYAAFTQLHSPVRHGCCVQWHERNLACLPS